MPRRRSVGAPPALFALLRASRQHLSRTFARKRTEFPRTGILVEPAVEAERSGEDDVAGERTRRVVGLTELFGDHGLRAVERLVVDVDAELARVLPGEQRGMNGGGSVTRRPRIRESNPRQPIELFRGRHRSVAYPRRRVRRSSTALPAGCVLLFAGRKPAAEDKTVWGLHNGRNLFDKTTKVHLPCNVVVGHGVLSLATKTIPELRTSCLI